MLCILTGVMSAPLLAALVEPLGSGNIVVIAVENAHFGGNTAVAGLLTGADIRTACEQVVANKRDSEMTIHFLLPDVCLNGGVFLDGSRLEDLQKDFVVEAIPSRGHVLKQAVLRFLEKAQVSNV
jgi:NifB/MoaA-like Fe-S oxidoreductase